MLVDSNTLWNEMVQQLEALDNHQARLQVQGSLAHRYGRLCWELYAQLGSQKSQLEEIIREWEEATRLYGKPRS